DRAVGQAFIVILPALDAEHVVQAILDDAGIDISQGKGAVAADHGGLETDLACFKRRRQGARQLLDLGNGGGLVGHGLRVLHGTSPSVPEREKGSSLFSVFSARIIRFLASSASPVISILMYTYPVQLGYEKTRRAATIWE